MSGNLKILFKKLSCCHHCELVLVQTMPLLELYSPPQIAVVLLELIQVLKDPIHAVQHSHAHMLQWELVHSNFLKLKQMLMVLNPYPLQY